MTPGTDWSEQAQRLGEILRGVLGPPAAHDGAGPGAPGGEPAECRWCPLCQLIAVLRGERPQGAAALADVLRATADALHAFAAATPDGARPAGPSADEAADPPVDDPPPVVQRIEIA